MDQIFDRLERLIKSWTTMDDGDSGIAGLFRRGSGSAAAAAAAAGRGSGDPDLDAAMSELDDFLGSSRTETEEREHREAAERAGRERMERERAARQGGSGSGAGYGYRAGGQSQSSQSARAEGRRALEEAYKIFDLPYGSLFVDVKAAYKKLLKKHHPDLNAQTPESLKRATAISSRINVAYQMIEAWEQSGRRIVG